MTARVSLSSHCINNHQINPNLSRLITDTVRLFITLRSKLSTCPKKTNKNKTRKVLGYFPVFVKLCVLDTFLGRTVKSEKVFFLRSTGLVLFPTHENSTFKSLPLATTVLNFLTIPTNSTLFSLPD